jgi:hypothetical protein
VTAQANHKAEQKCSSIGFLLSAIIAGKNHLQLISAKAKFFLLNILPARPLYKKKDPLAAVFTNISARIISEICTYSSFIFSTLCLSLTKMSLQICLSGLGDWLPVLGGDFKWLWRHVRSRLNFER